MGPPFSEPDNGFFYAEYASRYAAAFREIEKQTPDFAIKSPRILNENDRMPEGTVLRKVAAAKTKS